MLTRCPDCKTTFRITADALRKAAGQVRCGRCACVFDANQWLREVPDSAAAAAGGGADDDEKSPPSVPGVVAAGVTDDPPRPPLAPPPQPTSATLPVHSSSTAALVMFGARQPEPADPFDGITVQQVLAEGMADDDPQATRDSDGVPLVESQVDEVLAATGPPRPSWSLAEPVRTRSRSPRWLAASVAAALLLGLQIVHHYRADIAGAAVVGPLLRGAYSIVGADVTPRWDVEQYEIVDWVATSEPNANGRGSLNITAQIRNNGPRAQPPPHVHVRLMDRFESALGSRVFAPSEYSDSAAGTNGLMRAGDTTQAELDIVDPGPEAYGFELDVCVAGAEQVLRCRKDRIFPSM